MFIYFSFVCSFLQPDYLCVQFIFAGWLRKPCQKWAHDLCRRVRRRQSDDTAAVRLLLLLLLDLTTQFWSRRTSMWTASNRDTSELNSENRDVFQKTYDSSILTIVDWKGPGVGNLTQISMLSALGKSGRMWALLILALSLVSCAGGSTLFDQSFFLRTFSFTYCCLCS